MTSMPTKGNREKIAMDGSMTNGVVIRDLPPSPPMLLPTPVEDVIERWAKMVEQFNMIKPKLFTRKDDTTKTATWMEEMKMCMLY